MSAPPLPFGEWTLLDRLGMGGTSEVFCATHPDFSHPVALKRLLPTLRHLPAAHALLAHEIQVLSQLHSPQIPRVLRHGTTNELPWLALPLLHGANLQELLRAGPLDAQPTYWLGAQIAQALAVGHRAGFVHADLSPHNVFLTQDLHVFLLDWGIAQPMRAPSPVPQVRGKGPFLSPEQIRQEPLDARSDLFALGAVLATLLLGKPPFLRANRQETLEAVLAAQLPQHADLAPFVDLLAANPQQRPQLAETVADRLLAQVRDATQVHVFLRQRLLQPPRMLSEIPWQSAELRGEQVTDPGLDDGAARN